MKPLKIGAAMICEYVSEGSRGKHSLINVYTGDIRIKEMPAAFPIGIYVEILPQANQPTTFEIEVFINDTLQGKLAGEFASFEEGKSAVVAVPQVPVVVTNNGTMKFVATCPGFRRTTIVEKKITFDPTV